MTNKRRKLWKGVVKIQVPTALNGKFGEDTPVLIYNEDQSLCVETTIGAFPDIEVIVRRLSKVQGAAGFGRKGYVRARQNSKGVLCLEEDGILPKREWPDW